MSEKLIIRNFGPITNVELDLRKVNVLIGESGTGKSTIAKVLSFCKYFTNIQGGYFEEETQENKNTGIDEIENNLNKWGLLEYINEDSFVSYECEHYIFSFDNKIWNRTAENLIDNTYNTEKVYHLTSKIKPKTATFKNILNDYLRLDNIADFFKWLGVIMNYPFYVYGERTLQSIFSMGKDFTSNLSDPLFKFFVDVDKIQRNYKKITEIKPLNIEYKNVEGRGEIRKVGESKFISLNNAASGYMSVIPIVLIINYYKEFRKKKKSFIIEEPELNIFPTTQNELIKFICENLSGMNNLVLTTHSPYILTSLNNLMFAYKTGLDHFEEVDKIIPSKYWLNPNDVSAYRLNEGGISEEIIDKEGLIKTAKIDEASTILNTEFNKIFDLEFFVAK